MGLEVVGAGWLAVDEGLGDLAGVPRWLAITGDGSAWMAVATPDAGERLVGFDGEAWVRAIDIGLWGSVAREGPYGQLWVAGLDDQLRPRRLEWVQGRWVIERADGAFPLSHTESVEALEPGDEARDVALLSQRWPPRWG